MQTILSTSTRFTGTALPVGAAGNRTLQYAAIPADRLRSRRVSSRIAAQQDDKQVSSAVTLRSQSWGMCRHQGHDLHTYVYVLQNKSGVGLYEPEPKSISGNGSGSNGNGSVNNGSGANVQAGAELEKAISQLPPEQQQQLGRLYMFLTQHPEAKLELQSFSDVRKAMDNYQVFVKPALRAPAVCSMCCICVKVLLCRYCCGGQLNY